MAIQKMIPILVLLGLVLIGLSGCTNSGYKAPAQPGNSGGTVTPQANVAVDSTTLATELSSGTGTGVNDVSDQELDDLQNSLDSLDVTTDQAGESNI